VDRRYVFGGTGIEKELEEARARVAQGLADEAYLKQIHERFTYRMHDLGEFVKALLQRFTRWCNRVDKPYLYR